MKIQKSLQLITLTLVACGIAAPSFADQLYEYQHEPYQCYSGTGSNFEVTSDNPKTCEGIPVRVGEEPTKEQLKAICTMMYGPVKVCKKQGKKHNDCKNLVKCLSGKMKLPTNY